MTKLSNDPYLQNKYQTSPNLCDMRHVMVLANVLTMHKDIAHSFRHNLIGVDVDVGMLALHSST